MAMGGRARPPERRRGGRRNGAHSEQTAQRGVVDFMERQACAGSWRAPEGFCNRRPLRAVSRRLLGVSEVVALLPERRRGLPSVHRGLGRGQCRGLGMKAAASSMGGRNVALVWSPCEMEKGAKQTGIGGSEKQTEVAGHTDVETRPTP